MDFSASTPAVQQLHVTEPGDVHGLVPGATAHVTPFPPAEFDVRLTSIRLPDLTLLIGECSPLIMISALDAATMVLQFPLTGTDTLLLNGRPLPPHGFALYGPGSQLVRANPRPGSFALLAAGWESARANLAPAVSALSRPGGADALLSARAEDWHRMAQLVAAAKETAQRDEDVFCADPPRAALRAALLVAARNLVTGALPGTSGRRSRAPQAWKRIVLGAEEYLNGHLERPIYTEELCQALGVSPATLSDAFRATLTISPHRYLKLRRLNMVRAVLLRRDGPAPLVKSVALSHGFWHLGQFARDYREQFGEAPSDTLARAHGTEVTYPAAAVPPASRTG